LKNKIDSKVKTKTVIKASKNQNMKIKNVRIDESGRNISIIKVCKDEGFGIKFKFIQSRTLQLCGKVERITQISHGRIMSIMIDYEK
jgi:hypothetical protein